MANSDRYTLIIPGELPDLNKFIAEVARHRYAGGAMKKEYTELVAYYALPLRGAKMKLPLLFEFRWYCKDKRKDKDNIVFAKKFILDGLQMAGVIPQDTWNAIEGFTDYLFIDNKNPRIEVTIINYEPRK